MVLAIFVPQTAIIIFMALAIYRLMDSHNYIYGLSNIRLIDDHNHIYGLSSSSHGRP
jgi:hypothetical protein